MHKLNPRTAALLSAFGWAVGYLLAGKALAVLLPAPPAPYPPADTPPPSQRLKAVRRCGGSACAWSVSSCYGSFPVIVPYLPPGVQGFGVLSWQIYAKY